MEAQYDLLQIVTDDDNSREEKGGKMDESSSRTNAFPSNRVQKLLSHSQYKGVSTKVEVEGLFLQLNEDGSPIRQVFLALTQNDIFVVKQEIVNFEPKARGGINTDIAGLSIDQILPLPVIHFLILDDVTKYLTIITYTGKKYRFEMCQLDSGSTKLWKKWRKIILAHVDSQRTITDPDVWRTSYVISLHNGTAGKVRSIYATPRHLMPTRTSGIQTSLNGFTDENAKNRTDAEEADVNENETGSASSTSTETDIFDKTRLGYRLSDRLNVLFTRSKFLRHNNTNFNAKMQINEMTEREMSDMAENDAQELLHTVTEDREQSIPLRNTKSLNDLLGGQCHVLDEHMAKISLKENHFQRSFETLSGSSKTSLDSDSSESSADSDDEALNGMPDILESKGIDRPASYLWNLVRTFFIKRKKYKVIGRFQDIVRQVHFRILSQRDIYLAQSVIQLDVMDVSLQLTNKSRKLFLALSVTDLETFARSRGQDIRRPLERILRFNEDVRKMVITEVLKPRSLSGSVYVLKFFIQIGLKLLYLLHDFNSFIAIVRGLTSLPLYHLDRIWLALFIQEPFSFCHFLTIRQFQHLDKHRAAYVTRVNTCLKRDVPFIPLIDHILEHCAKEGDNKETFPKQSNHNDERKSSMPNNLVNMKRSAFSMPSICAIPEAENGEQFSAFTMTNNKPVDNQSPTYTEWKRTKSKKLKGPDNNITYKREFQGLKKKEMSTALDLREHQNHVTHDIPRTAGTTKEEKTQKVSRFRACAFAARFLSSKRLENKSTKYVRETPSDINTESHTHQVIPEKISSQNDLECNHTKGVVVSNIEQALSNAEASVVPSMSDKVEPKTPKSYQIKVDESPTLVASKSQGSFKKQINENDHQKGDEETSDSKIQDIDSQFPEELSVDNETMNETKAATPPVISLRPIFSQNERKRQSLHRLVLEGHFKDIVLARMNKNHENVQHVPDSPTDKSELDANECGPEVNTYDGNIDSKHNTKSNNVFERNTSSLIWDQKKLCQNQEVVNDMDRDHDVSLGDDESVEYLRNRSVRMRDSFETNEKSVHFAGNNDYTNIGENNYDSFEASLHSAQVFLTRFERNIKKFPQLIHYINYKLSNIQRSVLQESGKSFISIDVGLVGKTDGRFGERRKIPHGNKETKLRLSKKMDTANSISSKNMTKRKEKGKEKDSSIENEKKMQINSEAKKNSSFKNKILKTFGKARAPDTKQLLQNDIDEIAEMMNSIEINDFEDDVSISSFYELYSKKSLIEPNHGKHKSKTNIINCKDSGKSIDEKSDRNETECENEKLENHSTIKFADAVQIEQNTTQLYLDGNHKEISDKTESVNELNAVSNSEKSVNIPTEDRLDSRAGKNMSETNSKTDFTLLHKKNFYIPEIVERNERKSMFEESLRRRYQEDENDTFEHLKQAKLCGLEKKKSIVLDLLSSEEDEDILDEDIDAEPLSKKSLLESVTNLFKHKNTSNNSKFVKTVASDSRKCNHKSDALNTANTTCRFERMAANSTKIPHDDFNQNSILVLFASGNEPETEQTAISEFNHSQNNNGILVSGDSYSESCLLCNDRECLYQSSIGHHIVNAQTNLLNVRIQSCQRVKDFLKSVFTVNSYLTDFDLLQLSSKTG